ncbi:conserved hypothetical protein [Methylobacterium sp. 4-46]|uniref:hypothetical protein n=1 Tax=unclassified Methylobacterium TaxID=2615210 RepID=UPI000165CD30|nr:MULTISPECIES: hypothetical protein [Methylobacterium]ACA20371.1 conserved hypothetical protein [Methylobacterium sp. 4-46]WFT79539.1 hypothetical protein QA634_30745 [Methylobacterium nodulans]
MAHSDAPAPERAACPPTQPALRCRPIEEADLDAVVRLLGRGFPDRPPAYWRRGFARLAARRLPGDVPRYGLLLAHRDAVVGVLLTIYASVEDERGPSLRCNLSSWYVEPEFRGFGVMLDGRAMRDRAVTYLNISAAPETWSMHQARGFRRYAEGQMLVLPALSRPAPGQRVRPFGPETAALLSRAERALARDHEALGCRCLVLAEGGSGRLAILVRRSLRVGPGLHLPGMQLIYGPAGAALGGWLGALGRALLRRHAMPLLLVDAAAPVPGAVGRFFPGRKPRLARGPGPVALGDLAYTELAVFGA